MKKTIPITNELKQAVEYYTAMKDVRRIAFTDYRNSVTQDNESAHKSACNAVSHGASQIAEIIERMVMK